MWGPTLGTSRRDSITPRTPFRMREHVYSRLNLGSLFVLPHIHNVGVTSEVSVGGCHEHGLHGGHQIKSFNKHALREIDEEWSNQCHVKLGSSKCQKIVDREAGVVDISMLELQAENCQNLLSNSGRKSIEALCFLNNSTTT